MNSVTLCQKRADTFLRSRTGTQQKTDQMDCLFFWLEVKDSVTDNFSWKNFRDPTSLAYGSAPVFESLRKARRRFSSLAHEKSRLVPDFFLLRERRDSNPRPLP